MSEPEPVVVAVDFTASTLRVMLASLQGEVVAREAYELPELPTEEAWAWEVGGRIATLFAAEGNRRWAAAIGVACPGVVDGPAGRLVESDGQEGWDDLPVVEALRRHIDAPVVALGRTEAALRGEAAAGAAAAVFDALYVSLSPRPSAAILSSGRIVGGGARRAGALPAFPELDPGMPLAGEPLELAASLLADMSALLDPSLVVIGGDPQHAAPLVEALQRALDEVAPGPQVVPAALGEFAVLLGAHHAAAIVAYEGERADDQS